MSFGNGKFREKEAQIYPAAGKTRINAGGCVGVSGE